MLRPRHRNRSRTGSKKPIRLILARGRAGLWLRLGVLLLVATGIPLLYLHVSLARQFEGRLWKLPSRIYSDVLVVSPGEIVKAAGLVGRLDRSGYARTAGEARRPGQYALLGSVLDVHLRAFEAVGHAEPTRRRLLGFSGDRLRTVTDGAGRPLPRAVFEPELLATLFGPRQEERRLVALEEVPQVVRDAVLAAEDARFFTHHGLDLRGILRAALANARERKIVQGGSTITQQTVKNLFLGQERTWWRKLREGITSILLDARYSKERILEVYLNEVYLGQRGSVAICGLEAASRFYFGRDQQDLSLAESALLAGMIRSPGRYNPFADLEAAIERRDQVLEAMHRLGRVTEEQVEAARAEWPSLASGSGGFAEAPYAVDFVQSQLARHYSDEMLRREDLRIYTTVDTLWQEHAEAGLREGLAELDRRAGRKRPQSLQGVVLVTDPRSGAILAMVGGRDYGKSQFNRAARARRQPGSCFKPFVYVAGFERTARGEPGGLTPATLLDDSPFEIVSGGKTWSPRNYDREFRGLVSVRTALEQSLNVPTVRAAQEVGLDRVIEHARAMGIVSPLPSLPSLALGSVEVTPLELATAYGTLARLGQRRPSWIIREVVDHQGKVLAASEPEPSRAISPQTAYLVNDLLRGVLREGTAKSAAALGYRGEAAGKTGTTDDTRDAWFVGYTSDLLALVWVGYDDNGATGLTGTTGALPIWVDLMKRGGAAARDEPLAPPAGLVERRIDPETGGLLRRGCPTWSDELFIEGSEPTESCPRHGGLFRRWFDRLRKPREI